ncbi:unnamed protein product [Onchocerca ochengi]|uniref:Uncharacterized protein n=1 Tax=Onchocerca ochengi TaxID=42157 RepID=A0A182EF27_ONCOC|nr:unnamed protein product [Onchocerca ochengi]
MYSRQNGQRRGLLRPITANGGGSVFRILPLFGFLTGLLLFFFVFYIYQVQNVELYNIRNQIELERNRHIKVKLENIDFKAELEKYKSSDVSLKNELRKLRLSQKECFGKLAKWNNTLLSYMMNLKQLQDDKNICFTAMASMKAELALAKLTITTMRANFTSMGNVMETPKKIVESLKTRSDKEDAQESIPQEANLTASPLTITQSADEAESLRNISVQGEKMQENVLPEPVISQPIIATVKNSNNFHAGTIISVPQNRAQENQLDFLAPPLQLEKQSLDARNEFPIFPALQFPVELMKFMT